jgi:flagellar hook-length control protein FliK
VAFAQDFLPSPERLERRRLGGLVIPFLELVHSRWVQQVGQSHAKSAVGGHGQTPIEVRLNPADLGDLPVPAGRLAFADGERCRSEAGEEHPQ